MYIKIRKKFTKYLVDSTFELPWIGEMAVIFY